MAEKKRGGRRRNPHLFHRLALAIVLLFLLAGLAVTGWFIWSTVTDVVDNSDGTSNIKVQGINTETLTTLEKIDQERHDDQKRPPAVERDPFVMKKAAPKKVEVPDVVAPPATLAPNETPEVMPTIPSL